MHFIKKFAIFVSLLGLCGCAPKHPDTVSITFNQYDVYGYKIDDNGIYHELFTDTFRQRTVLEFEYGHELTWEEINSFESRKKIDHYMPHLNGCLYMFTYYYFQKNSEDTEVFDYLQPMTLTDDLTVYYGIFG